MCALVAAAAHVLVLCARNLLAPPGCGGEAIDARVSLPLPLPADAVSRAASELSLGPVIAQVPLSALGTGVIAHYKGKSALLREAPARMLVYVCPCACPRAARVCEERERERAKREREREKTRAREERERARARARADDVWCLQPNSNWCTQG